MKKCLSRREFLRLGGFALGAMALGACTPAGVEETVKPEEVVDTGGQAAVPAAQKVKISYWAGGGEYVENFYKADILPRFYDEHPDIEVDLGQVGSWKDLYNKLLVGAAGGTVPELCRQKDYYMPDMALRGILEKLDEHIAVTPHLQDESMWYPLAWENCKWEGEVHALPPNIFIHYPHMSIKLFEEAGLLGSDGCPPALDTWDDVRDAAAKITDPAKSIYGSMPRSEGLSEDTTNWFHVMLAQAGGKLHDDEFTKFTFNSPEGLDALSFITGMMEDGIMKPVGVDIPNIQTMNQVGIYWYAMNYWRTWPTDFPDYRWGTCINPKRVTRGAVLRSNHIALYKEAKNVDAGWEFLAFHERPEIDYIYGQRWHMITAQPANWTQPFYQGHQGENVCAPYAVEFAQLEEPGNQRQPIFPGYVEASFAIASRLQEAYLLEKSPEEALEVAEREANAILDETRKSLNL